MRRLLTTLGAIAPGACVDPQIDLAAWQCVSDDQCGDDMTCRAGVCLRDDGPLANGQVCVSRLSVAERDIRSEFRTDNGRPFLDLVVDGQRATFSLPADVIDASQGIAGCCESPCCKP